MAAQVYQPGEHIRGTVYRVVRHIATGGMGSVFDVEDTTVGKRYVLKTLHPDLFGRNDLARRMEQEARILARLQHPNIVEVVTAGQTQDDLKLPYYVMERLNGQNLRTVLEKKGALDRIHAYRIGIDLLDALAHAHDNGVIHRDVKPDNVFLHRNLNGTTITKLLDFGIMRLLDGAAKTDTMGRFVGTMRYASPEQVLVRALTPMTDVYSAGLVIYEMLTGQGPFDDIRDLADVGRAHIQKPPPPLSRFVDLPRDVEALVLASLAKEPTARPKDAFVYASELRRMLRDAESAPKAQTQVNAMTASPAGIDPNFEHMATRQQSELGSTAMPPTPLMSPPGNANANVSSPASFAPTLLRMEIVDSNPPSTGSEATLLVPVPTVAAPVPSPPSEQTKQLVLPAAPAAVPFKPTLLSVGTDPPTVAQRALAQEDAGTEPPTLVNQAPQATAAQSPRAAQPVPIGPTLASHGASPAPSSLPTQARSPYFQASPAQPAYSQVAIPSAPPPSPGTAMMPHPGGRPMMTPQRGSNPGFAPPPMTMQPATPLMQSPTPQPPPQAPQPPYANAQFAAAQQASQQQPARSPSMPPLAVQPQVAGGVDRNADTRGYQPPAPARAPLTDTHRLDEQGRTLGAPMEIVFPRGHGATPQTSTGGVAAETSPQSIRARKSSIPAIATGVGFALLLLVPTGFAMNRAMPPRVAGARVTVASAETTPGSAIATPSPVVIPVAPSTTATSAQNVGGATGSAPSATSQASAAVATTSPASTSSPSTSNASNASNPSNARQAHASPAASTAATSTHNAGSSGSKPAPKSGAAPLPGVDL